MTEIELKARIADYESTRRALSAFAAYEGRYDKRDTYWRMQRGEASGGKQALSIRLRRECPLTGTDSGQTELDASAGTTVATYKREKRQQTDSCTIEINDEQEFSVSDEAAFAAFLLDADFAVSHEKRKLVEKWRYGQALLELCTVPPLGDFLEIEILSQAGDDATVAGARRELESLLARSGVPLSAVESRYYSEMLGIDPPQQR
jgi:adenylate cyclase class 2